MLEPTNYETDKSPASIETSHVIIFLGYESFTIVYSDKRSTVMSTFHQ